MKTELRCHSCNRLLLKGVVQDIEIKCPKCGCLQRFTQDGNEINYHCIDTYIHFPKLRIYK